MIITENEQVSLHCQVFDTESETLNTNLSEENGHGNFNEQNIEADSSEQRELKKKDKIFEDHDSESDEDDSLFINRKRERVIFSSDEDTHPDSTQISNLVNESEPLSNSKFQVRKIIRDDSDSEDEYQVPQEEPKHKTTFQYRSDIFDTEITDDEADLNDPDTPSVDSTKTDLSEEELPVPKKGKIQPKKKSLVDRKQQMTEIRSTTQRMIRESEISLPYHRPKQHTLTEFLNRKKSTVSLGKKTSLKMSMKDINHLREIEERKKEVDIFFKSDSEDETEPIESVVKEPENETDANENDFKLPDLEANPSADQLNETSTVVEDPLMHATDLKKRLDATSRDNNSTLPPDDIPGMKTGDNHKSEEPINRDDNEKQANCDESEDQINLDKNEELNSVENVELINSSKDGEPASENLLEAAFLKDDFWLCSDDTSNHKMDLDDQENSGLDEEDDLKLHLERDDSIKVEEKIDHEKPYEPTPVNKSQRLSLLASKFPHLNIDKLTDVKPRLSIGEGDFVDLDEDTHKTPVRQQGLTDLLQRFVRHSNTKRKPADAEQVVLGVVSKEVSAEGEEKLVHSNVCVSIDAEKNTEPNDETPGARAVRLKERLRVQLLKRRERERQRRLKEKQFIDSEKVIEDYHEDGLPDEEPELTDQSETDGETESEPEEDDIILKDKKRKRNKYLDDEADVEDDENDNGDNEDANELSSDDAVDDSNSEREDEIEDDENESEDESSSQRLSAAMKRKSFSRISDDDDEEDDGELHQARKDSWSIKYQESFESPTEEDGLRLRLEDSENQVSTQEDTRSIQTLSRTNTTEDIFSSQAEGSSFDYGIKVVKEPSMGSMDSSFDWQNSYLPGYQPKQRSGKDETSLDDSLNASSLTLFSKLDFRRSASTTEGTMDNSREQTTLNLLLTPLKESQGTSSSNTQCIKRSLLLDVPANNTVKENATSDELLGLCSGKFTTTDDSENTFGLSTNSDSANQGFDEVVGLCSGRFDTQLDKDTPKQPSTQPSHDLPRSGDEAMSPLKTRSTSEETSCLERLEKNAEVTICSSDEEGILLRQKLEKKRKKRRRIVTLSDDDEDGAEESLDSMSEDELEDLDEDEEIEYDENEEPIIKEQFSGFKDTVKGGIRADFLEKEAELSGSEEGSDDEEEPDEDNDFMEQEEGDTEKFDEEELRNQVGRAHMKSLIDNDKRELRLLQEIYLEDGDLHGEGRQRTFRWKNIDKIEDGDDRQSDEEEEENKEDIEEEAEWRRLRIEREKFLQEQEEKQKKGVHSPVKPENATVSALDTSSTMKLVQNARKSKAPLTASNHTHSQEFPLFFNTTTTKRGSFLSRDQTTLKRLAEMTKENHSVGAARQGGNFVFQTLTEEEVEERARKPKMKANTTFENPPQKKLRIERSFFSMEESIQSTSVFKHL